MEYTSDPYDETDDCPAGHHWVAGDMLVHDEDVKSTARERAAFGGIVECGRCEIVFRPVDPFRGHPDYAGENWQKS